jgi:hypothetical protein
MIALLQIRLSILTLKPLLMSCFLGFSPCDFSTPDPSCPALTPTPCPDEMLPLLSREQPVQPNLDIILSKFLNNDELNDIEIQQLCEQER